MQQVEWCQHLGHEFARERERERERENVCMCDFMQVLTIDEPTQLTSEGWSKS